MTPLALLKLPYPCTVVPSLQKIRFSKDLETSSRKFSLFLANSNGVNKMNWIRDFLLKLGRKERVR